jgi:hypothetical protein
MSSPPRERDNYMLQHGIQHIRVHPDAHAQNGRIEQVHLTNLNLVRTYLIHTGLPQSFWAEGDSYAAYTRSRTLCGPQSAIPDDKWFGKPKRHDHLQPFGLTAYFGDHRHLSKLSPRYRKGLLVGYQEGTHNHRLWSDNKVLITRDVIFPTISGDDSQNCGHRPSAARIYSSNNYSVPCQAGHVIFKFQADCIKTGPRKDCGDGICFECKGSCSYDFMFL